MNTEIYLKFQRWIKALFSIAVLSTSTIGFAQVTSTGKALPGLEAFDVEITGLLQRWDMVPGASLALARDGKLILVKGYGMADQDKKLPVTPETLFRMGSINKTITAVAILRLVEEGKLSLDEPVLPLLAKVGIAPRKLGTATAASITVRNLLQHTGGMDRDISGDPFFQRRLTDVSVRQDVRPVTCAAIAKDTLEQPLDFSPGTRFHYSNAGYCMLGEVVKSASGMPYQKYVNLVALQPSIGKDYLAGHSTESMPNEAKYASLKSSMAAPGIDAWLGVPEPYGSYSIENMEALGAWVATPTDVLKFFLSIDGSRGISLLSEKSIVAMQARPTFSDAQNSSKKYYGLGIEVLGTPRGNTWFHSGSQPGLRTAAVRAANGMSWVIAFNGKPVDKTFAIQFDAAIWKAIRSVNQWPVGDLFDDNINVNKK